MNKYGFEDIPEGLFSIGAKAIDERTDPFLLRVFATYGKYSGFDLECLTHTEVPWQNARKGYNEMERCIVEISDEDMTNYYRSLISGDGLSE